MVSEECGMSRQLLSDTERGNREPSLGELLALGKAYGYELGVLFIREKGGQRLEVSLL
jgi:transcriptional regulator with XRE-family HTH domain